MKAKNTVLRAESPILDILYTPELLFQPLAVTRYPARVQISSPPLQDNGHLCTTLDFRPLCLAVLDPPHPHHFPYVSLPETVHVLCSNCRATFRPVEYMCCVFFSFALSASLRPLYLLLRNRPCSCFPSVWGPGGSCRNGENSLVVIVVLT